LKEDPGNPDDELEYPRDQCIGGDQADHPEGDLHDSLEDLAHLPELVICL